MGLVAVARGQWAGAPQQAPYDNRGELRALVLHHTARAPGGLDDARSEAAYMRLVQTLHLERGWIDTGYHFVVMPSGRVFGGRPVNALGAHVFGQNAGTVGIALAGNFEAERLTPEALAAVEAVRAELVPGGAAVPLVGHCELAATSCPGAALYDWLERGPGRCAASGSLAPI